MSSRTSVGALTEVSQAACQDMVQSCAQSDFLTTLPSQAVPRSMLELEIKFLVQCASKQSQGEFRFVMVKCWSEDSLFIWLTRICPRKSGKKDVLRTSRCTARSKRELRGKSVLPSRSLPVRSSSNRQVVAHDVVRCTLPLAKRSICKAYASSCTGVLVVLFVPYE